ncbi:hypothetical protein [Acidovorax sp. LjRoot194]|uniref:hypothetical protein n=1 Tax=Acidovorax sp. LjRoot194 TaxID=3342280 RepID=UPI003ECFC7E0
MKKYLLVAIPTGYAVAYHHSHLGWASVSEHATRESAQTEVDSRNLGHETALAIAASSLQRHREHGIVRSERRSVRYVPDDEFA